MQTKSSTTWKAWGDTDRGKKRENNEDRILCDSDRGIFVVVDGMGGEAAGEMAAQHAVEFIRKRLLEETGTPARRLREAIAGANNEIYRLAEKKPEWRGMACVLTAAIIEDNSLHIGHVGDSRLYAIRKGGITKLTSDHSPVGQKEDAGELTELEAMRHPRRNEVFRDVGSQPHKPEDPDFIEYMQVPFEADAAYLICSDGLSDMLTSREMLELARESAGNPQETVRRLIEKANSAGGKDNISAIVIEAREFAGASRSSAAHAAPHLSEKRTYSAGGRWAFLIFGLAVGLLAGYFWLRQPERPVEPPSPPVRLPALLHVAPGGAEYATISSALQAAQPGDRIEVADGEYEDWIRLKEGIEIFAETPGKAVLRIRRALPGADAAIIAESIENGGITGLAVKAEPAAALPFGIKIVNSSVNFSNVEVSGAMQAGVWIDGNSGSLISACFIYANEGPGVLISGIASPLLTGNLLYANGKSGSRKHPGLYITENSNPGVKRNVFSGNGAEAIRLQRQELKDRMADNMFINSGRRPVSVEPSRQQPGNLNAR